MKYFQREKNNIVRIHANKPKGIQRMCKDEPTPDEGEDDIFPPITIPVHGCRDELLYYGFSRIGDMRLQLRYKLNGKDLTVNVMRDEESVKPSLNFISNVGIRAMKREKMRQKRHIYKKSNKRNSSACAKIRFIRRKNMFED